MKRTPLFSVHEKLGARLVEFGGWEMPVQYTSITDEHLTVRRAAGLFDICHMGELKFQGPQAAAYLNSVLTNDLSKLTPGWGQYTLMCNPEGGVIDDLYAYCLGLEDFLLIVNASRITEDFGWLEAQLQKSTFHSGCRLKNISEETGAVAIQGPKVEQFIDQAFAGPSSGGVQVDRVSQLKKNQVCRLKYEGNHIWVSRTGYTGEDGFEVVAPANLIVGIWERLLAEGKNYGVKPAGLGARDTLRTEACYPLYGHELDEKTTPIEAGLGFFVSLDKGDFVGRPILAQQREQGVTRKLVAFKMADKSAPPRPHYPIWSAGPAEIKIGEVVSGTQSPSLNWGIGMGYVPPEFARSQTALQIEIRGRRSPAAVVPKPFYRKPS